MRFLLPIFLVTTAIASGETLMEWNFFSLGTTDSITNRVWSTYNSDTVANRYVFRDKGLSAGPSNEHTWSLSFSESESLDEALLNHNNFYLGLIPSGGTDGILFDTVEMLISLLSPSSSPIYAALFFDPSGPIAHQQIGETLTFGENPVGTVTRLTFDNLNFNLTMTNGLRVYFWSSNSVQFALGNPDDPDAAGIRISSVPEVQTASLMAAVVLALFAGAGAKQLLSRRRKFGR